MFDKKLGFYVCDNIEFESKIQACIYATAKNKTVHWDFNKKFFNNYNWSVEPEQSLDQLYDKRAREIREKYDYVIISYSGGADSHNLLMSFVRQGLHVDEIIVNTMEKADKNFRNPSKNNLSAKSAPANEHIFQTIPRLKEIQSLCPKTQIKILDLTDHLFEVFNSFENEDWIFDKKEKLHPANVTRFNYLYFKEVRKRFDTDKKITIVLGIEKPRIYIHSMTRDIFLRFTDGAANTVGIMTNYLKDYPNSSIEYFYWSTDSADMLCKQAHVIKKWLQIYPENQKLWLGNYLTPEIYRLVHERIYRNLIYTTWHMDWFQSDKSVRDWYCEFDDWFVKDYKNTKNFNTWLSGINYVEQNASKFIKYYNNEVDGLKMFHQDHKVTNINP